MAQHFHTAIRIFPTSGQQKPLMLGTVPHNAVGQEGWERVLQVIDSSISQGQLMCPPSAPRRPGRWDKAHNQMQRRILRPGRAWGEFPPQTTLSLYHVGRMEGQVFQSLEGKTAVCQVCIAQWPSQPNAVRTLRHRNQAGTANICYSWFLWSSCIHQSRCEIPQKKRSYHHSCAFPQIKALACR